jgi:hypothetical protein
MQFMPNHVTGMPSPTPSRTETSRHSVPYPIVHNMTQRRTAAYVQLRRHRDELLRKGQDAPNTTSFAWHLLPVALDALATAHSLLSIRPGFRIGAYLLTRRGRLAGGVPFAVEGDVQIPAPWACMDYGADDCPTPSFEGMRDFRDALDDSHDDPLTYASAALFAEDVKAFVSANAEFPFSLTADFAHPGLVVQNHRAGGREIRVVDGLLISGSNPDLAKRDAGRRKVLHYEFEATRPATMSDRIDGINVSTSLIRDEEDDNAHFIFPTRAFAPTRPPGPKDASLVTYSHPEYASPPVGPSSSSTQTSPSLGGNVPF